MKIAKLAALLLAAGGLLNCGGGATNSEPLMLVPSTVTITVNTQTGTVTGANAFQAFRDKTPVDLNTIVWSASSTTVPPSCFGVDQANVPHCNPGCVGTYSGTIIATISCTTVGASPNDTAMAAISCTYQ